MKNKDLDIIRQYTAQDLKEVLSVMAELELPIAGVKSEKLYKAFCAQSIRDERITMAVAESGNEVVGFAIAVTNWKNFWPAFFLKHPLLFGIVIKNRLSAKINMKNQKMINAFENVDLTPWLTQTKSGRSWSENSSKIAKTVYIGIGRSSRGKNFGRRLFMHLFSLLESKGVQRIDGWINPFNIPTIRMDHTVGFRIERCGNMLFATRDLAPK